MLGPDPESLDHRVLYRILGIGEVLTTSNQIGQNLRRKGPDELIEVARSPLGSDQAITSRTSIHS